MRHKPGLMRPDGIFSPLNHPLLEAYIFTVAFIFTCPVFSFYTLYCSLLVLVFTLFFTAVSHFFTTVVVFISLLVAHLLARMRLAILCWPLSSATHFFPEDCSRLECVWFITWFLVNSRHCNVENSQRAQFLSFHSQPIWHKKLYYIHNCFITTLLKQQLNLFSMSAHLKKSKPFELCFLSVTTFSN